MTLVLATMCPIDQSPPVTGIALIADTRLSFPYAGQMYRVDKGQKVFQLGLYAAYAYAGSSYAGLAPLVGLRRFFEENPKPDSENPQIDEEIEQILSVGKKRTKPDDPMTWFQGILVFANGKGSYTRMIYNPYYKLQEFAHYLGSHGDGPWLIGSGSTHAATLARRIQEMARNNPQLGEIPEPTHCACILMGALDWFANFDRVDPYVGGEVRGALITQAGGYHEIALIPTPKHLVGVDLSTIDPNSVQLTKLSALP